MAPTAKTKDKEPPLGRIDTTRTGGWLDGYLGVRGDPDPVVSRWGGRAGDYADMPDKDGQIFACLRTRRNGVLSCDMGVRPTGERRADKRTAEEIQAILDGAGADGVGGFDALLDHLLEGVWRGYAVAEVVWRPGAGLTGVEEFVLHEPESFLLDVDGALRVYTAGSPVKGEPVPEKKCLLHLYRANKANPYGRGVGRSCWWPYFLKKNVVRFWAIFAEKRAAGVAVGKYPRGAHHGEQDLLLAAIRALQTETGVTIPDDVTIDFVQFASTVPVTTFKEFVLLHDAYLAKIILGQTLTTDEGQHGTQALGAVHQGVKQELLETDAKSLQACIQRLVDWIALFNYGPGVAAPRFMIDYEAVEDLRARAEREKILVGDLGLPVAKRYLYETYGIPAPEEGEELLQTPARPAPYSATPFAENRADYLGGVIDAAMNDMRAFYTNLTEETRRWLESQGKKKRPTGAA